MFPHFLVAIADLTHPLSNNRSSIRIIGCFEARSVNYVKNTQHTIRSALGRTNDANVRPSFIGIGFGSGILLDLVLFADRIIAEPKSNRSILWDMEVCNDLKGVCAFF